MPWYAWYAAALVSVVVCFGVPVGSIVYLMARLGITHQMRRELEARKLVHHRPFGVRRTTDVV